MEEFNNINEILDKYEHLSIITKYEEKLLLESYTNMIVHCSLEQLSKGEDIPYSEDDFKEEIADIQIYLLHFQRIIKKLTRLKVINQLQPSTVKEILLKTTFIFSLYIDPKSDWSNDICSVICKDIENHLLSFSNCKNVLEFLIGDEENTEVFRNAFPNGTLKLCLDYLSHKFNKDNWKNIPFFMDLYKWMLFNTKSPHMGECVQYFLPPALFIIDDWELKHKVFAAKSLLHLVEQTPDSELRWYGRAEVIFEALKPNLYSRENEILKVIYPAITLTSSVLEKDPSRVSTPKKTYSDEILEHLLSEMRIEDKLDVRSTYAKSLKLVVDTMGILTAKWSNQILKTILNYIEAYEGEMAEDKATVLEVLQMFVYHCWPIIHHHVKFILKIIIKLIYEISQENSQIINKSILKEESRKVIKLLYAAAPHSMQELTRGAKDLDEPEMESIKFILGEAPAIN